MINTQIESLRHRNGWSQAELARRLHISPSTVGMYEQGRREPSISTLVALSQEFGVTIDYLITGNNKAITVPEISSIEGCNLKALLKSLSREELIVLLVANLMTQ